MKTQESFLAASRLFVRHGTHLAASVEVHPDHADQVRMSFGDALNDFAVVDVSRGGIGLHSGVFLPKNLKVVLKISQTGPSGAETARPLTIRAIVRRYTLVDHRPSYLIGLQFVDPAGRDEQELVGISAASKTAAAEKSAGRSENV
ncbi:MAG: PilZ domain-containing protein [Planctomycetia bacterium]|jgi:hypothetical protein|nr:PilZ domain-containing protein [Planctomycetia bacterium]MCC7313670.1 PilZ domain-containing protein [Planctomycetota bacterium]OQZ06370.1 MAG: hypothetical protein B6D36_05310 [Planctomycetes bacterium UTPLA1]